MTPVQANDWMVEHMFKKYPIGDLKNTVNPAPAAHAKGVETHPKQ